MLVKRHHKNRFTAKIQSCINDLSFPPFAVPVLLTLVVLSF